MSELQISSTILDAAAKLVDDERLLTSSLKEAIAFGVAEVLNEKATNIFHAVSLANLTRDVKPPATQRRIVLRAVGLRHNDRT